MRELTLHALAEDSRGREGLGGPACEKEAAAVDGGEGGDRDPVEVKTTGFGRAKTEHTREDHVYLGRSFQEHPSRDSRASDSTWVARFVLLWDPPSKKREGRTAGAPSPRPPPPPPPPRPLGPTHAVARDKRRTGRASARARARTPNRSRRPSSDVRRRAARPGQEDHLKDEKVRLCARFGGEGVGRRPSRHVNEIETGGSGRGSQSRQDSPAGGRWISFDKPAFGRTKRGRSRSRWRPGRLKRSTACCARACS